MGLSPLKTLTKSSRSVLLKSDFRNVNLWSKCDEVSTSSTKNKYKIYIFFLDCSHLRRNVTYDKKS